MKNILALTTAQDLTDWGNYFQVIKSPSIAVDPTTGLDRAAVVTRLDIKFEGQIVDIGVILYVLDVSGNPINGYQDTSVKNIFPVDIPILATNNSYISLSTLVVTDISGLTEGVDYLLPENCETLTNLGAYDASTNPTGLPAGVGYLPEFEAYRLMAKSQAVDLVALMANAINQSTKI
jgi:hypothetical protein